MENPILITWLNDFIFCPVSIYFHSLYDGMERTLYQDSPQINGTKVHEAIDKKTYSGSSVYLKGVEVYCEKYNLIGKIDIYNTKSKCLIERKNKTKQIYDGYVFQLYAQCFSMREMGYEVRKLLIHSIKDNKNYSIALPEDDPEMFYKYERTVAAIRDFKMENFTQTNPLKCQHCIYEPYCDREA